MYAQVMTTEAEPGLVLDEEETVKLWQDHFTETFKGAEGFKGAYVLGNPGDRQGITITLWESEEHADNSAALDLVLRHIRDSLGGRPVIEGYKVIFHA